MRIQKEIRYACNTICTKTVEHVRNQDEGGCAGNNAGQNEEERAYPQHPVGRALHAVLWNLQWAVRSYRLLLAEGLPRNYVLAEGRCVAATGRVILWQPGCARRERGRAVDEPTICWPVTHAVTSQPGNGHYSRDNPGWMLKKARLRLFRRKKSADYFVDRGGDDRYYLGCAKEYSPFPRSVPLEKKRGN